MIADLIDDKLNIRLITRNVMSVYSTNSDYTDSFIRKLKHSSYKINDKCVSSDNFISYVKKDYNIYKNIYRFVSKNKHINTDKFIEYLNYLGLNHLLWLHFYQLNKEDLNVVEILMQFASDKPVIIINYIDESKYVEKLYSLLFYIGLEDRLVIVPYRDITKAVNNATCQCYVKQCGIAKIQSKFPNNFLNETFNTSDKYYTGLRPSVYRSESNVVKPISYTYSVYELILIMLFSIKMLYIHLYNWRTQWRLTLPETTQNTSC